jgi:hypothetical protein
MDNAYFVRACFEVHSANGLPDLFVAVDKQGKAHGIASAPFLEHVQSDAERIEERKQAVRHRILTIDAGPAHYAGRPINSVA